MIEKLPPPDKLAQLVTSVTQTMLGLSFKPAPVHAPDGLQWRAAVLPIPGATPITVGLSSDQQGCQALSSAMYACPPEELDMSMMDDSLRELVNMTAGLVKSALSLDQALGLPQILGPDETGRMMLDGRARAVIMHAESTGLILWICEGVLPPG